MIRVACRLGFLALICSVLTGALFGKTNTTTTLTSSLNPSTYGSSVTFTAVISPSAATGKVTFYDGSSSLGTGNLSGGKTTFSTSTLVAGSHSITASYGGDSNYNTSTSKALAQTVNKANTTIAVASSANPSTYGSSVKFTATVTPSGATLNVTFSDGSTMLGTGTLSGGKATFNTSTLIAGSHSITASYGGDPNYNSSTSLKLSQTVNKANTTVTLSSSVNPSAYGSSVTFTATVTPSTATLNVTFNDGNTSLGTGSLSGGKTTFSTSTLALGSHSITAVYGGDTNYNSSTSATLKQVVEQLSAVTLSSSINPSPYSSPITFTASVTPSAATGKVTFMDGTTTLGTGTLSSGTTTFSISSLVLGVHSITAVYGGDSNYVSSTSPILSESVLTLTSIAIAPSTLSLPVGATQQFTATGTFSGGSTGNITAVATWSSSVTTVATVSAVGVATGITEGSATIQATVGTIVGSASVTGTPSMFRLTGSLITPREFHSETVLQNGQVLIAGGEGNDDGNLLGTCELYNPITGIFSATGNLNVPRLNHTATLLANGVVLITGGLASDGNGGLTETAVSELYNPATGTFAETGSLNQARNEHTATPLSSGLVLIAGGRGLNGEAATAELYNPATSAFTTTGTLNTPRDTQTATLLNDNTVLIAGGENSSGTAVAVAELYNSTTGVFTTTGSLNTASIGQTATLLNTGQVLIAGGYSVNFVEALARTELYNPTTKLFTTSGNMSTPRALFGASLLANGNVLLVGGIDNNNDTLASADLYNATTRTFSIAGDLNDARVYPTAALLPDGAVLIVGGNDANDYDLGSAETYQGNGVPPPPFSLQITPAAVNIVIGGTQQFTAIDNLGIPRPDATWTISNTSIATISTNANGTGIVTGVSAGQAMLTATADGVSAQEQVTILSASSYPVGTAIWSAPPPLPGYSVMQLAQAVPSANGPDLYSISVSGNGTQSIIQALQADGEQLWQVQMPPIIGNSVPDGSGGLIVTTCASGNPMTLLDLNATGEILWQQAAAEVNGVGYICYPAPIAVNGAGVAFIAEPTNAGLPSLTIAYPNGYIESTQFQPSTVNSTEIDCCVGPPMMNIDGTVYLEYEVRNTNNNVITSDTLYLYNETTTSSVVVSSTIQNEALLPGPIIPDGQGGLLVTWTISAPIVVPYPYQFADVTNGTVGAARSLPFSPQSVGFGQSPMLVLGENETAFASASTTTTINGVITPVDQIISFSLSSGATNWAYQDTPGNHLSIVEATFGNGLAAKSTDQNSIDTVLLFNSSGVLNPATRKALRSASKSMSQVPSELSGFSNVDYYSNGWWVGTSNGSAVAVLGNVIQSAMSSYAHVQGKNLKQSSAAAIIANFETVDPTTVQGSANGFQSRYQATKNANGTSLGTLTQASFSIYDKASESNFIGQVFKPIDAVAFIGHSLEGTNGAAIGLCFGQQGTQIYEGQVPPLVLPLYPCDSILSGGYGIYNPAPPAVPTEYYQVSLAPPSIASQAKIIFFAACELNAGMQNFMGITNSTVGRALLFPQSVTDIDLDMGEFEWLQILANLEGGGNLQQAVAAANAAVVAKAPWYDNQGNIVPPQAWQVIGDSGNGGTGIHF
jgi:hypothetical protein